MTEFQYRSPLFNCRHESRTITEYVYSNGSVHYRWQCDRCHQSVGNSVRRDEAFKVSGRRPLPFRRQAAEAALADYNREVEEIIEKRLAAKDEWWRRYNEYLSSKRWQIRRGLVLDRAKGMCEGCGMCRATQVHHLTYAHVFDELLYELVAICEDCHQFVHGEERESEHA